MAKRKLSEAELERRVGVLKRFRELLEEQRDRFRSYLEILDKQKDVIEKGTPEELLLHVEMEEKLMADIHNIQKVIDPIEDMYRALYPVQSPEPGGEDISGLKSALESLRTGAAARSERNKELLSKRMAELRSEITSLRSNPYLRNRSPGAGSGASLLNIEG